MKTPFDTVKGKITDINEHGIVTVKVQYDDWQTLLKRDYKECMVQMIDSRPLSNQQRRACYALLREISDYTGESVEQTKEIMKIRFLAENLQDTADQIFSLSNAPMSLVCAFQRYLVRFILDYDIPCRFMLLDYVDDVDDYIYGCLLSKKCAICGKHPDLHHCEGSHVGMGFNREEIVHEGLEVLPLCREHHMEVHQIGAKSFKEKYHLNGGIRADKAICKIYKLKTAN